MIRLGINFQLLSQSPMLEAGSNVFRFGPERGMHWVLLQLTASYEEPEIVAGYLRFVYEKPGTQNMVTIVEHPTDNFVTFPLVGGSASRATSTYAIHGQRRLYVDDGDAIAIRYEGAPPARQSRIRGLILEAAADVDLTPWM